MNDITVAIIIPVKSFNARLEICLEKCLELDYPNFKILVFPDVSFSDFAGKIKVIPTGNIGPALKRDKALEHSKAEIFAFLDDDAYPERDWLKNAIRHFQNEQVAAVGGPAVTPDNSPMLETASGNVLASPLASGPYWYRYVPGPVRMEVDDYPSCNFIIRRNVFEELGGFSSQFWPGEDTKLCLDITKRLGKKIIYDPKVCVQHHRRPLFYRICGR
ncbi:MAG: glycosyltransferase [Candidatus Omnitrophica bacterium]|nr:glycosyltransferase [Candidatus Omnitrophota bacterium]